MLDNYNTKKSLNVPVIDLKRPSMEINSKTYFAYSPTYFMQDKKPSKKDVPKELPKNHRVYYDNYLINIEEIFNKNHDKQKGVLVHSGNAKSSRFEASVKPKTETTSVIHSKLGTYILFIFNRITENK